MSVQRKSRALYRAVIKYGSKSLGLAVMAKRNYEELSDDQKAETEKIATLVEQAFKAIDKENGKEESNAETKEETKAETKEESKEETATET